MHPIEPVPFFLPAPGRDTVGLDGIRSTSHTVTGLLHADAEQLMFEWSTLRQAAPGAVSLRVRRAHRGLARAAVEALSAGLLPPGAVPLALPADRGEG